MEGLSLISHERYGWWASAIRGVQCGFITRDFAREHQEIVVFSSFSILEGAEWSGNRVVAQDASIAFITEPNKYVAERRSLAELWVDGFDE
uniref:Uncharacterized protein n=1 Tax=Candidatus Kentrum sp. TC TaxID=2126339 RepID=A0A450YH70_9GAMM|nr:MAG: hypothetical protein BECKTC1821D_GA0114238_100258 [Candidatus Kentron sp. TC]VFK40912.1 MAG: hypothetical protein BECKTC1821E_GA0114239_100855 [Candidatus Kentron sp. TC]